MKRERFVPHALDYLERIRAFPAGAMPEIAYKKLCDQYAQSDIAVERVTYAHDGLSITGLIATPNQPPKGVVLYNRGGSGNYGILTVHAVTRQFIPLAQAGYLVVGSNYRGNDGSDGKDEFGGRDVEDALELLKIANPGNLPSFLIGHSRGGMQSFLMMQRGYKPNAAIAIAPVCDVRGWERIDPAMQESRTVLAWPEAINAPLLILHGTKDEAIPHSQSVALDAALAGLDKPHELVLYDGGNHALTRHWDDVTKRTLEWMQQHG